MRTTATMRSPGASAPRSRVALSGRQARPGAANHEPAAEQRFGRGPPKAQVAEIDGFNLHASVVIGARDTVGRERLLRYVAPRRGERARHRTARWPRGASAEAGRRSRRDAQGHGADGVHGASGGVGHQPPNTAASRARWPSLRRSGRPSTSLIGNTQMLAAGEAAAFGRIVAQRRKEAEQHQRRDD